MPEKTNTNNNEEKTWRGIKQDPKSNKFIVYITQSTERLFDSIEDAVNYMVTANFSTNITKSAGSPEYSGVERGQSDIDGVKEVHITRKLVKQQDGSWVVKETIRTDLIKDNQLDATKALNNIDTEKTEAKEVEDDDSTDIEKKESSYDREYTIREIGKCSKCGTSLYPPSFTSSAMDEFFDRNIPADLFCPCCGYGLSNPGAINYTEVKDNTQSVDNLIEGY